MIKKSIFVILAMFGFSSVADMHTESNHMSDMMDSSSSMGEESGFNGAVEMKAHILEDMSFSYRARMGWMGDVNEQFQWGVAVSSAVDGNKFGTEGKGLAGIALEQAYVSYEPMDGWSIMAGKHHWKTKFNKTGVLYDDDLYVGGVNIKYHHGEVAHPSAYFKAGLNTLGDHKGTHANGTLLNVKIGGNYAISDGVMLGVYASAQYDGLFDEEATVAPPATAKETPVHKPAEAAVAEAAVAEAATAEVKTLAQFGVNVMTSNMAVPVGAFGVYVTDTANFSDNHSWNAGVYVGKASTPQKDDANDFGVSVSYYDINAADHNTALVDTDYVSGAGKGIAVRAQYNLMDSVNVVAKYNRNLDDNANNLIGELTFNF